MKIQITEEIQKFIALLEKLAIARVLRTIDLLEQFGYKLSLPHSKSLGRGLFELRVRGKQEVRLFYGYFNNQAIIFHSFIKKSKSIPGQELVIAYNKLKNINLT